MVFLKSVIKLAGSLVLAATVASAQTQQAPTLKDGKKTKTTKAEVVKKDTSPLPAPSTATPSGTPTTGGAVDKELDDAILPYYNNYLKEYRLGPGDQVSVEVFGQCPDYCKAGITVPPNAKISYPLVREGIFVAGKTVEQVAAEITKRLDEYIIDPKVTVTLDKAIATRYSVMGNVQTPGVRVMDRRVSVYEAVLDAGGVTKNGNSKQVAIVSYAKNGRLSRKVVNLADMEAGRADMVYLEPGDQVFVTGKGLTLDKVFDYLGKASMMRYMAPL
jgi:polysaccharide export outer membrane protein